MVHAPNVVQMFFMLKVRHASKYICQDFSRGAGCLPSQHNGAWSPQNSEAMSFSKNDDRSCCQQLHG